MSKIQITLRGLHDNPGFFFYKNSKHLFFETNDKVLQHSKVLCINRLTCKSEEISQKAFYDLLKEEGYEKKRFVWLIYGIIVVQRVPYLALVESVNVVAKQHQGTVYQISSMIFVSFDPKNPSICKEQELKILGQIETEIVKQNFYFSYQEDLTLSYKKSKVHTESDCKFFWNQKNTQFLFEAGLSKPWMIPVIQGYVCQIIDGKVFYRMVSRRSKFMSGTRYNNRGIDADGNASNLIETEETIFYEQIKCSHVMIRGSVPIFWRQEGLNHVQFPKKDEESYRGLKRHYESLLKDYGNTTIYTINLLSDGKEHEKALSQKFYNALYKYSANSYFHFDLNAKSQSYSHQLDQQHRIDKFIFEYTNKLSTNNFEYQNGEKNTGNYKQHFIARINCLDCVDRTNIIACRIGENFVRKVYANILNKQVPSEQFMFEYMNCFAQLGNRVSLIYCGTNSIAEHLVKRQETSYWSSLTNSLKSVNRYYNASNLDPSKELHNNMLLLESGESETEYFKDNVARMYLKQTDYCEFDKIKMVSVSWNVAAIDSRNLTYHDIALFRKYLFQEASQQETLETRSPEIIFITLQEILELSSYNVVTDNHASAMKAWESVLLKILNEGQGSSDIENNGTYKTYLCEGLVGLASFLFVKSCKNLKYDILSKIKKHECFDVKRGIGGTLGNKGSIISAFCIEDTKIINFASHLAAGDEKSAERAQDIKSVFYSIGQNRKMCRFYNSADFIFFTGDLNFRLNCQQDYARQIVSTARKYDVVQYDSKAPEKVALTLQNLHEYDEYLSKHSKEEYFRNFREMRLNFMPTYRYEKGTDTYSEKRKPAWCDRVLYFMSTAKQLEPISYSALEKIKISDHRPVVARFEMEIRTEDKDKKGKLVDYYLAKHRKNVSSTAVYKHNEQQAIQTPNTFFPKTHYKY